MLSLEIKFKRKINLTQSFVKKYEYYNSILRKILYVLKYWENEKQIVYFTLVCSSGHRTAKNVKNMIADNQLTSGIIKYGQHAGKNH